MSKLDYLVPPTAILLWTLIAMFVISRFDVIRILEADDFGINLAVASLLVVAGVALAILGIKQFRIT